MFNTYVNVLLCMTDETSLLRCTIKKSVQVLERVVVSIASLIVGVALCGVAYFAAIGIIFLLSLVIIAITISIPWYYYAGIIALLSIPTYSAIWCIARELPSEDWESDDAKDIAAAVAFAFVTFVAFVVVAAVASVFVATVVAAVAFVAFADSKYLRFLGAYLHYRKRMRAVN